ncbi:PAAR domain-containing protein [Cupriavidus basilensis]|uniref:PAAR domain-containing protein n=1 Tax=Cupriavidus basilensis TaxID=68895 RepID=A0A0C4YCT4_9BURK|nr:PAAR domain-containing protein [Cupriavidus basilensis]AJG20688.1 hypothetical protein RR42_m3320 [Cupriavidus basilensis]
MPRKLIKKGDKTTHGGEVISGSASDLLDGQPMARLGDLVSCPLIYPDGRPHGTNKIVEASSGLTVEGGVVACEGDRTACGCQLIANTDTSAGA